MTANPKKIIVIGITGTVGSGKSELSKAFANCGVHIIDVDKIGHELLTQHKIKEEIKETYGNEILNANGEINRSKLASLAFKDEQSIAVLNQIMHPPMIQRVSEIIKEISVKEQTDIAAIDAALLFEMGLDKFCDLKIFVNCSIEKRINRVKETRGWQNADIQRREHCQWKTQKKLRQVDIVFQNEGDRKDLGRIAKEICHKCREPKNSRGSNNRK